jgi:GT2 family glycosyltransferase
MVRWLRLAGLTLKDGRLEVARRHRRKILEVVEIEPWPSERPIVSVIIPCFNYGEYLEEAVDSALDQTLQDSEVIIIDDGSTDLNTVEVLEKLDRPRTRVIQQANTGLPGARNTGIGAAKGRYICCLDADDTLVETYLEKAVALLESRPDLGFAYSWVRRFGAVEGVWEPEDFNLKNLLDYNHVSVSAVFRRQAWEAVGGYWDDMQPGYEDWEFWIRLGAKGYPGKLIPEPLLNHRRHERSMIDDAVEQHERLLERIHLRHARLYENPDLVGSIQDSFLDRVTDRPMMNLSRPDQFDAASHGNARVAVILGAPAEEDLGSRLNLATRVLFQGAATEFHFITGLAGSEALSGQLEGLSPYVYHLPHFLPQYAWDPFVGNYIQTREISVLMMWGSVLGNATLSWLRRNLADLIIAEMVSDSQSEGQREARRKRTTLVDLYLAADQKVGRALELDGIDQTRIELLA